MSEKMTLVEYSTDPTIAELQAESIFELVDSERSYLKKDPDRKNTATRYRDSEISKTSQRSTASNNAINAYILEDTETKEALGLATVIFNIAVVHPDKGIVMGHNLDYWLKESSDDERHREIAEKLVLLCREQFSRFTFPVFINENTEHYPYFFAATQNDSKIPPIGFTQAQILNVREDLAMEPIGSPKRLKLPMGQLDPFEVAATRRKTQLYAIKA